MAKRRMFNADIVESDHFVEMPPSTQALYFHLGMRADDDGIVNCPNRIQRDIGASTDDLKILAAKGFIIPFESGVIVVTHWKINNYLQKDRYTPTIHTAEKNALELSENKAYEIKPGGIYPKCIQNVSDVCTQYSIDKNSIDNNIYAHPENAQDVIDIVPGTDTDPADDPEHEKIFAALWELYPRKKGKGNVKTAQKKKIAKIGIEEMTRAIERYKEQIRTHKTDIDHVQYGGTFFNSGYIDYLDANYQKEAAATPTVKPGSFGNFTQRNHDDSYYDELQNELIAASLKHTAESEGT